MLSFITTRLGALMFNVKFPQIGDIGYWSFFSYKNVPIIIKSKIIKRIHKSSITYEEVNTEVLDVVLDPKNIFKNNTKLHFGVPWLFQKTLNTSRRALIVFAFNRETWKDSPPWE